MGPHEFTKHVEGLTGRPVYPLSPSEEDFLIEALADNDRTIDCSQFNELLLIVNKDRVTDLFFTYFFGPICTIKDIEEKIRAFRKTAMLCFGNFIYAYRTLSKARTQEEWEGHLADFCKQPSELVERLQKRTKKILKIKPILRDKTYLVGYLSAGPIRKERTILADLLAITDTSETWEEVLYALEAQEKAVKAKGQDTSVARDTIAVVERYSNHRANNSLEDFKRRLQLDVSFLAQQYERLETTLAKGTRNTDIYLSWDHMDIYFATSMRKRWEYESLYDFVSELVNTPIDKIPEQLTGLGLERQSLKNLHVRYFDPTQSYDKNRINKGLIEALMLKRATCTVYSVQDTDTLGKDSELAATLAQGKPVIAFAPPENPEKRVKELKDLRPADLKSRVQFVLYEDEKMSTEDRTFLWTFVPTLDRYENQMLWKSIADENVLAQFQRDTEKELERFCAMLADSEERIYRKRVDTLRDHHPLGLQVNLVKGVANGVLVVRDVQKCAQLLLRILTNTLEFDVKYDKDTDCWWLVERISKSIYRVVTNNRKLTNCFWNFYVPRTTNQQ